MLDIYKEYCDQTYMDRCKNKGLLHQICNDQTHPLLLGYKTSPNSNSGKMALWDTSPSSSQSSGFLNKTSIPYPPKSSLDLLTCRTVSW